MNWGSGFNPLAIPTLRLMVLQFSGSDLSVTWSVIITNDYVVEIVRMQVCSFVCIISRITQQCDRNSVGF